MASQNPPAHLLDLFTTTQAHFASKPGNLNPSSWYILVLSALCAAKKPSLAADLYLHLTTLPQYKTPEQRQALMRRIRETLLKSISIIGVGLPLEAILCIDAVTRPEDKDTSFSREYWHNDEANHARGTAWLQKLYSENLGPLREMFKTQRDFGWVTDEITYGLYLSDHSILNGMETELVVLSGMVALGLPRMTAWHLRACRRIGLTPEECEIVQSCIERVVEFAGVKVDSLPRVKDIEHEV